MKFMKMSAETLFINGTEYVIPGGMTDKEVTALCGLLLRFRRVEKVYSSDYADTFAYQQLDYISVQLSHRDIYVSEDEARSAREARNAEIAAAKLMSEPEASD